MTYVHSLSDKETIAGCLLGYISHHFPPSSRNISDIEELTQMSMDQPQPYRQAIPSIKMSSDILKSSLTAVPRIDSDSSFEKQDTPISKASDVDETPTDEELQTLRRISDKISWHVYTIAFVGILRAILLLRDHCCL